MKNISVIGSGTMGNGIAHTFAQYGYQVSLIDVNPEALKRAVETITKNLDRMVSKGSISEEAKGLTLHNITTYTSLQEGVKDADLVIEAATENPEIKKKIFADLNTFTHPETILATNTSSISITEIASASGRPHKVIGMHFMNPVPMMKLVEVIKGYQTDDVVCDIVIELSKKIDKIPTLVNDYPGFISNRILLPMINEAIFALFEGIAGVEEIDNVMKLGMSHPMGPLQLADFIGLDVCLAILEVLHDGFKNPKYAPCPLLVKMVAAGELGVKSKRGFYDYSHGTKELRLSYYFSRLKIN
jgi:3-hydroxybutyryl-CoA dehydrogenase